MGQSRPRFRSSNWSSDRCLVVPNFLCYDNACSMRLDRYRAFHQISFFFRLCFPFLLSSILSPTEAQVDDPLFLVVCSNTISRKSLPFATQRFATWLQSTMKEP